MIDKVSKPSPTRLRREEEKERRRAAILNAAEQVIAKSGWDGLNFGAVAKRTRLSRSLIYVYFPTREDLFLAVCHRGLSEMARRFRAAVAAHRSGLEQVMAIGEAYYRFSKDEPLYFEIVERFQEHEADPTGANPSEQDCNNPGVECLGQVVRALETGLADGSVRKAIGSPQATAIAIWAFTHGLIQIAARKQPMLKEEFGVTSEFLMKHGFTILHNTLGHND
jgi:AcrR family transcriptional regulator